VCVIIRFSCGTPQDLTVPESDIPTAKNMIVAQSGDLPAAGKVEEDTETLHGFQIGKPVLIEESFPLKCSIEEFEQFFDPIKPAGLTGCYWGQTIEELTPPKSIGEGLTRSWLEMFRSRKP
jgi:hypothetical protein